MLEGDQLPVIPLGDVVASVGGTAPEQSDIGEVKLGVWAAVTVTLTVSDTSAPHELVAVSVTTRVPVAFAGIVNCVLREPEFEKVPELADHTTDW